MIIPALSMTPPGGQGNTGRVWPRLYPHEFRADRADEMLGVLMASTGKGQNRPTRSDVSDIVRGSLAMRLRGPRGGWPFTLAAFALVAPLFLVLTDIRGPDHPHEADPQQRRPSGLARRTVTQLDASPVGR